MRAVFLDRDGVLNRLVRDECGVERPPSGSEGLELVAGAADACRRLKLGGFALIVATNQPDVARGRLSRRAVEAVNAELERRLPLDEILVCYHDDGDGCSCRKPQAGLLVQAAARWNVDLTRSFMVGDRASDVAAGRAAGCTTILVGGEEGSAVADYRAETLREAAAWILGGGGQLTKEGKLLTEAFADAYAVPPASWSLRRRIVKRTLDLVLGAPAVLVLSPIFVALAVAVLFADGRPILYRWNVVGLNGRRFTGWKFRTMIRDADRLREELLDRNEMTGPVFKLRSDPRVTRLGHVLRRYSLDELPQFWSVVKGDMSLVGPRPSFPHEYAALTPEQRRRLSVKPGITCLWQIECRSSVAEFDRWLELDFRYIDKWSLALDAKILIRTLPAVVSGRGAW
ncbi:MAG: HAD-IIIA family hydrolase [Gaiellaceae bacterium]